MEELKTNKTFEQYKAESLDELANLPTDIKATIVAGLRNCWNAALASVVEEPVLTWEDGVEILLHALNMPDAGKQWAQTAMTRLLSLGRISASNPTPDRKASVLKGALMMGASNPNLAEGWCVRRSEAIHDAVDRAFEGSK